MNKIFSILCLGILFMWGCEEKEIAPYSLTGEQINFWVEKPQTVTPYPDELMNTYNFGVNPLGENLKSDTLWLSVETQGFTPDVARNVVFKIDTVYGERPEIEFLDNYIIEAGETTASFPVVLKRSISRDAASVVMIGFDYDRMNMSPGVTERQQFSLTVADVVTPELLKITAEIWHNDFSGWSSMWNMYLDGYGTWSSAKARFLITMTGYTDFSKFPSIYDYNWEGGYDFYLNLKNSVLPTYKNNSAIDPETYPPYYDETQAPGTWITFN